MWISEIAERAILSATSDMDVTFRASRVDDEEMNPKERGKFPSMAIEAAGGTQEGNVNTHYDVPVSIVLTTLISGDPKRTILAGLEDELRNIIDQGITGEFNTVSTSAGESWYLQGIVELTGSMIEYSTPTDHQTQTLQSITTTGTFKVCGSFTA